MEIRHAAIEDIEQIVRLEQECFPPAEAAGEEAFRARLSVFPEHFWLLFDEDTLVSMVNGMVTDEADLRDEMYESAKLHNEEGRWQMIFGVTTAPAYRRQGLAEQVLRQAIADAKTQGRKGLVLTCKERLLPYYSKFGFINEGISGSVHGNARWYQMRLKF